MIFSEVTAVLVEGALESAQHDREAAKHDLHEKLVECEPWQTNEHSAVYAEFGTDRIFRFI